MKIVYKNGMAKSHIILKDYFAAEGVLGSYLGYDFFFILDLNLSSNSRVRSCCIPSSLLYVAYLGLDVVSGIIWLSEPECTNKTW